MTGGRGQSVSEYFEEQVRATPESPAFIFAGQVLSYAELNSRANQLAWWLRDQGIGPESVVAIALRRGVSMAVTILGIMKAGGAYLPLDQDDPPARHSQLLRAAGAVLTLTDDEAADVTGYPRTDPPALASADNLLYVVYTSGSTGQPKGIAMCHGPTMALMAWSGRAHRRRSRTLHYFPITADVGSYELISTWLSGGCVVMTSEQDRYDAGRLLELIERHQVQTVLLPFLVLDQLARVFPERAASLTSLREIVTTGDRLTITAAIREMCAALEIELLENQWGSTEVNVVTAARLRQPAQDWPEQPSIGGPVADARVYALDDNFTFSPPNVPGELYVGGGPLSRGYAGRPDLTALAFVPDPLSGEPGSRMYRTGDLGRWRPDGELEFLGRADFQVKVHAYRIEPGEIEAALRDLPGIAEAVVIARDIGAGQPSLIAYVVADGEPPPATAIRAELRKRLPSYMVPEHCVPLARLPVTATGKVDRSLLPAPIAAASPARTDPRDETEKIIAAVWAELLGVADVAAQDNFFALGGHSLLVNQIVYRLNEQLGVEMPIRTLFEAPTVATLAQRVRDLAT